MLNAFRAAAKRIWPVMRLRWLLLATMVFVAALPGMADQVALLVYEDEMPPDRARAALKTDLLAEWKLERRSARHTEIVKL